MWSGPPAATMFSVPPETGLPELDPALELDDGDEDPPQAASAPAARTATARAVNLAGIALMYRLLRPVAGGRPSEWSPFVSTRGPVTLSTQLSQAGESIYGTATAL